MRELADLLVAAAGIWCGWWACDIRHRKQQHREPPIPPYPISEPHSNVLAIMDDGDVRDTT